MLKILSTLVDRCIFTLTFILGLQLPEFIQQYSQRLSGHVNEALLQLNEYQVIANRHFGGNLTSMIDKYLMNNESSIKETANIIINTSNRVSTLQEHLLNMQQADYVKRVYYFITQFDKSMAQYQLAIPLNLSSLITGGIFAMTILLTGHLIIKGIKHLVLNITSGNTTQITDNKKAA